MSELTPKQKKNLRAKAHALKPVVIIGNAGLTDNVLAEIDQALDYHELIKVRVNAANKTTHQQVTKQICNSNAALVQSIGHIIVLFREKKAVRDK